MATSTRKRTGPVRPRPVAPRQTAPTFDPARAEADALREELGEVIDGAREYVAEARVELSRIDALQQAVASGAVPSRLTSMNLPPALPFQQDVSAPIDLGDTDERYRGSFIIVDMSIPTGVIRQLQSILDRDDDSPQANIKRAAALRDYVTTCVLEWNLTHWVTRDGVRTIEALKQPQAGGVDQIPMRETLQVIVQAVEKQFQPAPKSLTPSKRR